MANVPRSFWRVWVLNEAQRIERELAMVPANREREARETVEQAIAIARGAAESGGGWHVPWRLRDWWTGAPIETAWRSLHRAQETLLLLQDEGTVRALLPEIDAAVAATLTRKDPRHEAYRARLKAMGGGGAVDRDVLRTVWLAAHEASDITYTNLRALRNQLFLVFALVVVALAGVTALHGKESGLLPLCGEDPATTTTTSAAVAEDEPDGGPEEQGADDDEERTSCPSGGTRAGTIDAVAVQSLGALGALLSAAVSMARQRRFQAPYGLPAAQVLLKLGLGAMTALFGVILLENGVLGLPAPESAGALLAYAALFGYAQQVVTRSVDERARSALGTATTKGDPARDEETPTEA